MCLGAYGVGEDSALHVAAGTALAGAVALKIAVVRWWHAAGRFLPLLGITVFLLLAVTWFTAVPGFLGGED
jgi:hypothetical protein